MFNEAVRFSNSKKHGKRLEIPEEVGTLAKGD